MPEDQSEAALDELERSWLGALGAHYAEIQAATEERAKRLDPGLPYDMVQLALLLRQRLRDHEEVAAYLEERGRSHLRANLNSVQRDIDGVISTFAAPPPPAPPSAPAPQTSPTFQTAFNEAMHMWHAQFTHSCPHCSYYVGPMFPSTKICPKCGRLLHDYG